MWHYNLKMIVCQLYFDEFTGQANCKFNCRKISLNF